MSINLDKNIDYQRKYVSGHFQSKIGIPDIIYLLEALAIIMQAKTETTLCKGNNIMKSHMDNFKT